MRIVINASAVSSVKGGASFYIVNIVKALAAASHQHTIIILCTRTGASYFPSPSTPDKWWLKAPKNALLRLFWEQACLPFICLLLRADLLFSPNYTMPLISFGHKNIVTIHDLSFFPLSNLYPLSRRLFKPIIHLSARFASGVIAVSECTKRDIVRYIGKTAAKKTFIIFNAADERFCVPDATAVAETLRRFTIDKSYILFTGFLEPRKNLKRLIAAYGKVCHLFPHDLVIAGGNGWWFEDLPETVDKHNISKRIRFLGYVPDDSLQALYAGADLFAFVSLYEGFGIAALEAITCGTPVLASNNTALPEVVGDAGIYADPYSVDDIAEKLMVVSDMALMEKLRSRCSDTASKFSWKRSAEQTLALFESVHPEKR